MSDLGPFAFSIGPEPGAGWRWRAVRHDGRVAEGQSPTRAVAAACVIRVLAGGGLQARRAPEADAQPG